jgi:hypothetical protein
VKTSLLALTAIAAFAGLCAAQAREDPDGEFLEARKEVFRLHGSAPLTDARRLYERALRGYKDTGKTYFLYKAESLALLSADPQAREEMLFEILQQGGRGGRFVLYLIEFLRANGALDRRIGDLLPYIAGLSRDERLRAARALSFAYAWQPPPDGVETLIREFLDGPLPLRDFLYFNRALAGWGHRDQAVEKLRSKGLAADLDPRSRAEVAAALAALGAVEAAREVAAAEFAESTPAAARDYALEDIWMVRQARFSRLVDIASPTSAWDLLLAPLFREAAADRWRSVDAAVVLDAARMPCEAAEQLALLRKVEPSGHVDALYGGALVRAGDSYSARDALLSAAMWAEGGEDLQYDLADSLAALRDVRTMTATAKLQSLLYLEPQQARTLSDLLSVQGEYAAADTLFTIFVEKSGLGSDTRFAWQGRRLWAVHYLDTGRLEEGRKAAFEAVAALLEQPNLTESIRSPVPDRFVALFKRFGGVADLYEYCGEREKNDGGILLYRIEQAALEFLGRWDEAIALEDKISGGMDPVNRDLFKAAAYFRARRYDDAARRYRAAIAADAQVPSKAYEQLAAALARLGRWEEVEEVVRRPTGAGDPMADAALAAFFESYGRTGRAARTYRRLDDLSLSVGPGLLSAAVRLWVKTGDIERAAGALSRRIAAEAGYDRKLAYLSAVLPAGPGLEDAYLALGTALENGVLGADAQLLARFYRALGAAFERTLAPESALSAYRRAAALEKDNPENMVRLCLASARLYPAEAAAAARRYLTVLPDPMVLIERIRADFESGDPGTAREGLGELSRTALSAPEQARITIVLERFGADEAVISALTASGNLWPWVLRARLQEKPVTVPVSSILELRREGAYVGRALWAVRVLARAGLAEEAQRVLAECRRDRGAHPSLFLLEADIARSQGRVDKAVSALEAGRRSAGDIVGVARLFDGETAYVSFGRPGTP